MLTTTRATRRSKLVNFSRLKFSFGDATAMKKHDFQSSSLLFSFPHSHITPVFLPLEARSSCGWNCGDLHQEPIKFVRQNLKWCPFTHVLLREDRISFLQEASVTVTEVSGITVQEESNSHSLGDRQLCKIIWWNNGARRSDGGHTCRWLKRKTSMCSSQARDSTSPP